MISGVQTGLSFPGEVRSAVPVPTAIVLTDVRRIDKLSIEGASISINNQAVTQGNSACAPFGLPRNGYTPPDRAPPLPYLSGVSTPRCPFGISPIPLR